MTGTFNKNFIGTPAMDNSWVAQKINEIKQNPAWQSQIDESTSHRLLSGQPAFTFLLREGKDMYHYFLSFVDANGFIEHKAVKIELSVKGWFYRNGGANSRDMLDDLIPVVLHCTPQECRPYRGLNSSLFMSI